mmetsp:Transcript_1093/g.2302  ORF Transcript_1093/g.2302 Transcript_1093/m.2302 type:complete len:206 (+) Transcript_1093:129-746(+)
MLALTIVGTLTPSTDFGRVAMDVNTATVHPTTIRSRMDTPDSGSSSKTIAPESARSSTHSKSVTSFLTHNDAVYERMRFLGSKTTVAMSIFCSGRKHTPLCSTRYSSSKPGSVFVARASSPTLENTFAARILDCKRDSSITFFLRDLRVGLEYDVIGNTRMHNARVVDGFTILTTVTALSDISTTFPSLPLITMPSVGLTCKKFG